MASSGSPFSLAGASSRRQNAWILAKIAVLVIVTVIIAYNIDVTNLFSVLLQSKCEYIFFGTFLMILGILINSCRWSIILGVLGANFGLRNAIIGNFEAALFNQLLPTSIGGDAVRIARCYDCGVSLGIATTSVLVDRVLGLWISAVGVCVLALVASEGLTSTQSFILLLWFSIAVAFGGVMVPIVGHVSRSFTIPFGLKSVFFLFQSFTLVFSHGLRSVLLLAVLAITTVLSSLSFQFAAMALGIHLSAFDSGVVMLGLVMASIIPLSIGGWGVREGAAILLMAGLNVGATEATAVSIVFGLMLTSLGFVGAAVWSFSGYRRFQLLPDENAQAGDLDNQHRDGSIEHGSKRD